MSLAETILWCGVAYILITGATLWVVSRLFSINHPERDHHHDHH